MDNHMILTVQRDAVNQVVERFAVQCVPGARFQYGSEFFLFRVIGLFSKTLVIQIITSYFLLSRAQKKRT
jgi:hypothetical protein